MFKANPCVRLVLMDCEMPLMDGYQAASAIRGLSPDLRITGVSGHQGAQFLQRCKAAGMNDAVTKPVSLASLAEIVAEVFPFQKQ